MTQSNNLLLVVSESGCITTEARAARRVTYQAVADKIGAELLVTGEGCGAQLLEVPVLTQVEPEPSGIPVELRNLINPPRPSRLVLGVFLGAAGAGLLDAALHLVGL